MVWMVAMTPARVSLRLPSVVVLVGPLLSLSLALALARSSRSNSDLATVA